MDIFINGKQGAGKSRAADVLLKNCSRINGRALHVSDVLQVDEIPDTVRDLVQSIRDARARAVLFDGCLTDNMQLLIAVQAVKEVRVQINADILAIYVQQVVPSLSTVPSPVLHGAPFDEAGTTRDEAPAGAAAVVQDWKTRFTPLAIQIEDLCKIVVALCKKGKGVDVLATLSEYGARRASELKTDQYAAAFDSLRDIWETCSATVWPSPCLPVKETMRAAYSRYAASWDAGKDAYVAANLVCDGVVLTEAVNVYAFEGALKLGDGKRAKRFMLFELAEIVPVSGLHVAVDKMNTHYFEHGTFEKRAFNLKNVRPAKPDEVMEYLNAKYQYTLKNS